MKAISWKNEYLLFINSASKKTIKDVADFFSSENVNGIFG